MNEKETEKNAGRIGNVKDGNNMMRRFWRHSEVHPLDMIENRVWERLSDYGKDNLELLISEYLTGEREDLAKSIETGLFFLNITENTARKRKRDGAFFSLGMVKGALAVLGRILGNEVQSQIVERTVQAHLSGIKNLDEIVSILNRKTPLTHMELAEAMGEMNKSTLTENMKKIVGHGLVYSRQSGKYKYYYLTDSGRRYAASLGKKNTTDDLSQIRRRLDEMLRDRTTREQTISMLRQLTDVIETAEAGLIRTISNYEEIPGEKKEIQENTISHLPYELFRGRTQRRRLLLSAGKHDRPSNIMSDRDYQETSKIFEKKGIYDVVAG